TAYVPLLVQDGLHGTPFLAGAAVAPMSLGWPVGSVTAGRLLLRAGYERLLLAGSLMLVAGTTGLAVLGHSALAAGIAAAVMGLGMGLLSTPVLIVIQSSVPHQRRGAATAFNQLARTVGGALGVGLMGILVQGDAAAGAIRAGVGHIFWVLVAIALCSLTLCAGILIVSRRPATAES
ncbi:MAG: MFS transporter, partial [Candidatus Dormibacteraeota bacterium]|nr:MFS transporter [Candidatus Dormibacteraeota bacterium]